MGKAGHSLPRGDVSPPQEAVAVQLEPERLVKILEVLRELPVPNYRCVRPGALSPSSQAPAWLLPSVTPV